MPNNTFPRDARLLSTEEYNQVFKKNNNVRASAKGIVILASLNNLEHARLGLVVPKKILKRAVWRNRVKRLVRESFRLSQNDLPQVDLVFLARPGIGELSNSDISTSLNRLWAKISRQLGKQQSQ